MPPRKYLNTQIYSPNIIAVTLSQIIKDIYSLKTVRALVFDKINRSIIDAFYIYYGEPVQLANSEREQLLKVAHKRIIDYITFILENHASLHHVFDIKFKTSNGDPLAPIEAYIFNKYDYETILYRLLEYIFHELIKLNDFFKNRNYSDGTFRKTNLTMIESFSVRFNGYFYNAEYETTKLTASEKIAKTYAIATL